MALTKTEHETLENIAKAALRVETLQTRNSDRLDFYDCAVWSLEDALERAYRAGKQRAYDEQDEATTAAQAYEESLGFRRT